MDAFSARMLVCSAMSLMSSTMLPISCELTQALDALAGLLDGLADAVHAVDGAAYGVAALVGDIHRVARDVRGALGLPEIASVLLAMLLADSVAPEICFDCALEAFARCADSACVCRVAPSSWMADWLMVLTRSRSTPMA